jgi:hypothetical protein
VLPLYALLTTWPCRGVPQNDTADVVFVVGNGKRGTERDRPAGHTEAPKHHPIHNVVPSRRVSCYRHGRCLYSSPDPNKFTNVWHASHHLDIVTLSTAPRQVECPLSFSPFPRLCTQELARGGDLATKIDRHRETGTIIAEDEVWSIFIAICKVSDRYDEM